MLAKMRSFFPQFVECCRAGILFWVLLLALSGVIRIGLCVPSIDNSYSLSYGAATGKGQVVQPVNSPMKATPVQSAPVTTTKTIVEVTPMKAARPAPAPTKKHDPVCIDPFTLGIPTVQNCGDLKIMGAAEGTLVSLQEGFENCALMDDTSCDNGSGEGLRSYQARLSKSGGVAMQNNPGVGPCLSVDRRPDGSLDVKTAVGWSSSILCCRPVCYRTTTTTTISSRESLLPMEDPTPAPTYAPVAQPVPFAGLTARIPVVTTPTPAIRASFGEMCVMPKYLDFPRVSTCEDLRDLALSTSLVELVNVRAADCDWIDDSTCGPAYPGLGAYLEGGVPDQACLAYKQTQCGNVVGPYPILGKHTKDICRRSSSQSKGNAGGTQMMPVMMMPMQAPSKGKGGRRLEVSYSGDFLSMQVDSRRLHGKGTPSKGSSSDTVVLCCRLQCNGGSRAGGSMMSAAAMASLGGGGSLFQLMPSAGNMRGAAPEMRGFAGINASRRDSIGGLTASANRMNIDGESDLCNARYSIICSLATPLNGEQIVFDQRCVTENLPGCSAGGLPCCRSVSLLGY